MLHELFMVMTGHSDDIFVPYPLPPLHPNTFIVRPDFLQVHPAEREILDRLAQLGFWYNGIQRFIEDTQTHELNKENYPKALAQGFQGVLNQYIALIDQVETEYLQTPTSTLPLTALTARFSDYFLVLKFLFHLLKTYRDSPEKYFGTKLIDLVLPLRIDGRTPVINAANCILKSCLHLLFRQILMCILHANIHDPKKEFFIQFDESGKLSDYESHVGLVHSLVPDTLISLELAETIHFVTQTSRILRQAPKHLEWLSPTLLESHCSMILKLLDPIEDFRPLQLSIAIDKFRTFYGQGLWKLIVAESKLFEYVSMIRLFFLGGRGDFLHRFLDLYEESHRIATVHDLNRILRSCQYLLPTLETLHPFIFEPLPADHLDSFPFQPFSSQVTVTWSLPWPLSHIITSDHLHRYSQILMLLLHLKQVQMKLLLLPSCVALVTLRARQQMIRCLYAFETYFQTEMEILYQDFLKTWSQQEDVRAWAQRHTQFVVNASRLLFLENLALRDAFANLLKCIHQFCIAVTKHYDLSLFKSNKKRTPPMKEHNLEVLRLNEVFVKEFKFLFLTLQGLRTTASLLPIQHLLLQLDFNWYWSLGPSGVAYYEERNLL